MNFSIGPDIELFSYLWGGSSPPTITATLSGGASLTLVSVGPTFMPADAIAIGTSGNASGPVAPSDVTIAGSVGFGAANGAGLHLSGASSLLVAGNTFGNHGSPNSYGIQLDAASGMSYAGVQVRANNLSNNSISAFRASPSIPTGANISISDNANVNPIGIEPSPSLVCGTPTTNPFPEMQQVYVSGAFTSIKKNGAVAMHAGSTAIVSLDIGESLEIDCSGSPPGVIWYGL